MSLRLKFSFCRPTKYPLKSGATSPLKELSHHIFGGLFLYGWVWVRKGTLKLFFCPLQFLAAILKFWSASFVPKHLGDSRESPRRIYKCEQPFSEISYFLLGESLEICWEMNLKIKSFSEKRWKMAKNPPNLVSVSPIVVTICKII